MRWGGFGLSDALIAQLRFDYVSEPPSADPHARWCGSRELTQTFQKNCFRNHDVGLPEMAKQWTRINTNDFSVEALIRVYSRLKTLRFPILTKCEDTTLVFDCASSWHWDYYETGGLVPLATRFLSWFIYFVSEFREYPPSWDAFDFADSSCSLT